MISIAVAMMLLYAGFWSFNWYEDVKQASEGTPWYAGYVDVTVTPSYNFEQALASTGRNVALAFIVADQDEPCEPSWGGVYTLEEANESLDLDRRVVRLENIGAQAILSFGGARNTELSFSCTDETSLIHAYHQVLQRYGIRTVDLDIEGDALRDLDGLARSAKVWAHLQEEEKRQAQEDLSIRELGIWLTLPVGLQGLTPEGVEAVRHFLKAGVDLAGVNAMTMNLNVDPTEVKKREENQEEGPTGQYLAPSIAVSLQKTHRQLQILYEEAQLPSGPALTWQRMGATALIGINDIQTDVFTLNDAKALNQFAHTNGLGRISMWSLNRDHQCGPNQKTIEYLATTCSGVEQEPGQYSDLLAQGFEGNPEETMPTPQPTNPAPLPSDDPEKSPYEIWRVDGEYPAGAKVVWHGNVYEAKWWNRGEAPDAPVLYDHETPWDFIGPVLPDETPKPEPTLPPGVLPTWDEIQVYERGDLVVFEHYGYRARWWNRGESPQAADVTPETAPWERLSRKDIRDILTGEQLSD